MIVRKRARKDAQKAERRETILRAAWELFQDATYSAITMAEVAERAHLAKGTLFLYFGTKEELFLALTEEQLGQWFDAVDAGLSATERPASVGAVVSIICAALAARPAMERLLAIQATVLEQNIDRETALRFKRMLLEHTTRTGALLEAVLPFLAPGQGAQTLLRLHALVVGLQHLADPAPVVRPLLDEPGLHLFAIDFTHELSETLRALLLGLEYESRGN